MFEFDHDIWDQGFWEDEQSYYRGGSGSKSSRSSFVPDPLYYHLYLEFDKIRKCGLNSVQVVVKGKVIDIPKRHIKNLDQKNKYLYVWKNSHAVQEIIDALSVRCRSR